MGIGIEKAKFKITRYWWTPYLCSLIAGYMVSKGYPCRVSKNTIYHNKKITNKDILRIGGYMDCLREIGYILED